MKQEIEITIDGIKFKAKLRKFKSGREGYGLYGRTQIENYPYQISCNIIKL